MGTHLHLGLLLCYASVVLGSLFPTSREIQFTYHAVVQVGTDFPSPAVSQFSLGGLLKVQSTGDEAVLQLTDIATSLYNGDLSRSDQHQASGVPIPEQAGQLLRPFKLQFKDGAVAGLSGVDGEAEWSVNIKRALASLLQLDTSQLDNPAFIVKENGLYGSCDAEYTVQRREESFVVRKFIDHSSCPNHPSVSWTNAPSIPPFCHSGQDDFTTSSSERIYVLKANKNLESILARGGVYNQPFKARGELQYVLVNQTLAYQSESDISTPIVPNVGAATDLLYRVPGDEYTQGRNPLKQASVVNIVKRLLKEISEGLEKPPKRNPDVLHDERVSFAIYYMTILEKKSLEAFYNELAVGTSYQQETLRKLFLELLPKVGTSSSILLVRDLVTERRVADMDEATRLMMLFPFYVRQPSEELLRECEVLSDLPEDEGAARRQVGILSFATLIFKTCKLNCSPETRETYVRKYLDRFLGAADYEHKMIYLEGLSNIEDGKVFEYLEPVVRENSNKHLRFLAVWATMNVAPYHPVQVYNLYWPILTNIKEPLEMRVAALTMLVVSKPSTGRLFSLHWFMTQEKEPRLKHFYYTTLQSLVNTKDPCYSLLSIFAARVLRLLPSPTIRHWATGNYVLDHANEHHGFGAMAQLFLVGNPSTDLPNVFYLKLSNYGLGLQLTQTSVYLKLVGVAHAVKERLLLIDPNSVSIPQVADILRQMKASPTSSEEVHLEMIIKSQDRVLTCLHLNKTNFHLAADALSRLYKVGYEVQHNIHHLDTAFLYERTIPTDLGIPALTVFSTTGLTSLRGNHTQEAAESRLVIHKQLELRQSAMGVSNLEVYNPVMDLWHGVRRSIVLHVVFPFDGKLSVDTAQNSLKFNIARRANLYKGIISHIQTAVFLRGKESAKNLRLHCPSCKGLATVTKGDRYKRTHRFLDAELKDFGIKVQGDLFDCEHHISLRTLESAVKHQNYQVFPASRPFVVLAHLLDSLLITAPPGSCGKELKLANTESQDTELEGSIQVSSLGPKTSLNVTLLHKRGDEILYEWDLNADCQRDGASFNLEVDLVRDARAVQDSRKLCLDAVIRFPAAPANKYLVKLSDSVTADITMDWAAAGGERTCGGESAERLPFQVRIVAETSPEQQQLATTANTWPFDACKADNNTVACHSAAHEMATLRKYSISLNYTKPIQPEMLLIARTSDGRLVASAEVSPLDPVVYLTLGSDRFKLDTPRYWLDPLLLNTQYPALNQLAMGLGLITPEQ